MESNELLDAEQSAEKLAMRLLTLDEIVEECNKEATIKLNFVGADEKTGYLLFELVTMQPDGSITGEIFLTDEDMDEIGFAVYEGYGEVPER